MSKFQFTPSRKIWVGLILGIIFGFTLGDYVAYFSFIGDIFVRMLQVTVLPYIIVSLISSVGSLTGEQAKGLAKNGALLIGVFWILGLILLFVMPLSFPKLETAFFYSIIEYGDGHQTSIIDEFIPANVFKAMSDSVIPAIVLFCVFIGAALIGLPNKKIVLEPLNTLTTALGKITNVVIDFSPIGIFSLTATAVGEMDFSKIGTLGVYMAAFIGAALIMTFVLMPAMVCSLTKFRYRQVVAFAQEGLLMAFSTGSTFVALTIIERKAKEIFSQQDSLAPEGEKTIGGVLPVIYNLPSLGNILPIVFILFVSWFYKTPLDFYQNIDLAVSGLMSLCGSDKNAVPFLLREMKLPGDAFDLYLMSNLILRKFMVMTTAMFLFAVCVISAAQAMGQTRFYPHRAAVGAAATLAFLIVVIVGIRFGMQGLVLGAYRGEEIVTSMHLVKKVPVKIYTEAPPPDSKASPSVIKRIKERGALRVGYNPSMMPFSYRNKSGEIVGYDIANAHALAADLKCNLELVPLNYDRLAEDLNTGVYDIIMSKLSITPARMTELLFSTSYLNLHSAFVVKDDRLEEFRNLEKIKAIPGLRIGIFHGDQYIERIKNIFPKAQIVILPNHESFFSGNTADVMLTTAEEGSTWTLLHPAYGVVISQKPIFTETIAYAIPPGDLDFFIILNNWLTLNNNSGRAKTEYDYWILGKMPNEEKRHWSLLTKMLHWDYRFAR